MKVRDWSDIILVQSNYYQLREQADRYRQAKEFLIKRETHPKPEKHPTKKTPYHVITDLELWMKLNSTKKEDKED